MSDMENSGSISKNEDKNKPGANPNWPDYKGKAQVGGVLYWVSGWAKKGRDGGSWMSLAFKPRDGQPTNKPSDEPADTEGE